jgi:hypothetical protein
MGMNLHAIVRGPIGTVNPEFLGVWRESAGYATGADFRPTPAYVDHANTPMQVQALSGKDLLHTDFQSMQGVKRAVYLFGNVQGVVRPDVKGGDLLLFPEVRGGANRVWLVVVVMETWGPDTTGWCRVGVVLQTDVAP